MLPNRVARLGVRAKEIGDECEHVVHLLVAGCVGGLPRRHRVGAHPEALDPAVDKLIGFVERDVVVDQIAQALRHLGCEARDAIGKARIERPRALAGSLHVKRPRVVHERDHRRHSASRIV